MKIITCIPRVVLSGSVVAACLFANGVRAQPNILDGAEQQSRFAGADTTFSAQEFPVIQVTNDSGDAVLERGPEYEDVFPTSTTVTEVIATIAAPSGDTITVTTLTGPTWTENAVGDWEATFAMPAPNGSLTGTFEVEIDGGSSQTSGGSFKIKNGGTTPPQ